MLDRAKLHDISLTANQVGGMFGLFFSEENSIENFEQVSHCDIERFNRFFHSMLDAGVNMAPSAYEAGFMSSAHTLEDINQTLDSASAAFANL
jgi:glutamate-1-semialdehyde 2,1-aminomutase